MRKKESEKRKKREGCRSFSTRGGRRSLDPSLEKLKPPHLALSLLPDFPLAAGDTDPPLSAQHAPLGASLAASPTTLPRRRARSGTTGATTRRERGIEASPAKRARAQRPTSSLALALLALSLPCADRSARVFSRGRQIPAPPRPLSRLVLPPNPPRACGCNPGCLCPAQDPNWATCATGKGLQEGGELQARKKYRELRAMTKGGKTKTESLTSSFSLVAPAQLQLGAGERGVRAYLCKNGERRGQGEPRTGGRSKTSTNNNKKNRGEREKSVQRGGEFW